MITQLIEVLNKFAQELAAHPDFELYTFKTFEGLKQEEIQEIENQFFEKLQEKDDFEEDLMCKSYFMPYGDAQMREKLQIPQSPVRLSPLLNEFYQTTNGLQLIWEYNQLPSYAKYNAGQFLSKFTQNQAPIPWDLWTGIGHHWALGSIFILPLEKWLRTYVEDGNFYWRDKKKDMYYPVLPFDFYDNWSTSAFLLKEGMHLQEVTIGEDSLAAFGSDVFSLEEYFQNHLLRTKSCSHKLFNYCTIR